MSALSSPGDASFHLLCFENESVLDRGGGDTDLDGVGGTMDTTVDVGESLSRAGASCEEKARSCDGESGEWAATAGGVCFPCAS